MFGWIYIDSDGEDVGSSQRFEEREAAEDWMGQSWASLADFGVEQVVLHDHSRGSVIYRMGLGAE